MRTHILTAKTALNNKPPHGTKRHEMKQCQPRLQTLQHHITKQPMRFVVFDTPDFERNMSDDMLRALAQNGGVVMINFGSAFLDSKIQEHETEMRARLNELLDEHKLGRRDPEAKPLIEAFQKENPKCHSDTSLNPELSEIRGNCYGNKNN
jgi:nitroreductase